MGEGSGRVRVVASPSRATTALAAGSLVVLASVGTAVLVLSSTTGVTPDGTVQALPQAPGPGQSPRSPQSVVVPPRPGSLLLPSAGPSQLPFRDDSLTGSAGTAGPGAGPVLPTDLLVPLLPADGAVTPGGDPVVTTDAPVDPPTPLPGPQQPPVPPVPVDPGTPRTPAPGVPLVDGPAVDQPAAGRPSVKGPVGERPDDVLHGGWDRRGPVSPRGNAYGHLLAPGLAGPVLAPGTPPAPQRSADATSVVPDAAQPRGPRPAGQPGPAGPARPAGPPAPAPAPAGPAPQRASGPAPQSAPGPGRPDAPQASRPAARPGGPAADADERARGTASRGSNGSAARPAQPGSAARPAHPGSAARPAQSGSAGPATPGKPKGSSPGRD